MIRNQYIKSFELLRDNIKSFSDYPYNLPVVKYLNSIDLHDKVTFFIGENGAGKSTLLEAIAIQYGFNAEWWSKNFNFSTTESTYPLAEYIRLSKGTIRPKDGYFLRAESFYNVASVIDTIWVNEAYWWESLHNQSHWESFFSLFMHRFFWNGLYILDEPEAALSPQRQLSFLVKLHELVQNNSQFIIATHSPIILSYPHAKIIYISEHWFEEINYKDSEHYNTYKMFLNNPSHILNKLDII